MKMFFINNADCKYYIHWKQHAWAKWNSWEVRREGGAEGELSRSENISKCKRSPSRCDCAVLPLVLFLVHLQQELKMAHGLVIQLQVLAEGPAVVGLALVGYRPRGRQLQPSSDGLLGLPQGRDGCEVDWL